MSLKVQASSKLSEALKLHPDVLNYIVSLNPHDFHRLHNPLMRKLMPPRITLARLAQMTHTPILTLLERIHQTAQSPLSDADRTELASLLEGEGDSHLPANLDATPEWVRQDVTTVVDLLESDARLDADPMPPIFRALKKVAQGDTVLVKHQWEPQPLYDIWSRQGIDYFSVQQSADEWWIYLRSNRVPTRQSVALGKTS